MVEVCVIKDLETAIPTAVDLETQDGTASSKENSYVYRYNTYNRHYDT